MRKLLQQAQQMQAQVAQAQEELASREFEATAGGGAVAATVTGDGKVVSVTFVDPELLVPADAELVGDLVVAAVNQATAAMTDAMGDALGSVGGLDLSDLGGLLG